MKTARLQIMSWSASNSLLHFPASLPASFVKVKMCEKFLTDETEVDLA